MDNLSGVNTGAIQPEGEPSNSSKSSKSVRDFNPDATLQSGAANEVVNRAIFTPQTDETISVEVNGEIVERTPADLNDFATRVYGAVHEQEAMELADVATILVNQLETGDTDPDSIRYIKDLLDQAEASAGKMLMTETISGGNQLMRDILTTTIAV